MGSPYRSVTFDRRADGSDEVWAACAQVYCVHRNDDGTFPLAAESAEQARKRKRREEKAAKKERKRLKRLKAEGGAAAAAVETAAETGGTWRV